MSDRLEIDDLQDLNISKIWYIKYIIYKNSAKQIEITENPQYYVYLLDNVRVSHDYIMNECKSCKLLKPVKFNYFFSNLDAANT